MKKKEREIRNLIASCNGRSGYVSAYVHTVYISGCQMCVSYTLVLLISSGDARASESSH